QGPLTSHASVRIPCSSTEPRRGSSKTGMDPLQIVGEPDGGVLGSLMVARRHGCDATTWLAEVWCHFESMRASGGQVRAFHYQGVDVSILRLLIVLAGLILALALGSAGVFGSPNYVVAGVATGVLCPSASGCRRSAHRRVLGLAALTASSFLLGVALPAG